MEIKKNIAEFDLPGFIETTRKNREGYYENEEVGQIGEFVIVNSDGSVNEKLSEKKGRDVENELTQMGYTLFFPFVGPIVEGDFLQAADGVDYKIIDEGDEEYETGVDIGDSDVFGYAVNIKSGQIIFKPALYSSGMCMPPCGPNVGNVDDCGIFCQGMINYVNSFGKC